MDDVGIDNFSSCTREDPYKNLTAVVLEELKL